MDRNADRQDATHITAIHIAPASRLAMQAVTDVVLTAGHGIPGDRYENSRHRHITVQSQAALDDASRELGATIEPAATRRNITVSHGEIPTRPGDRLTIGEVTAEVVRVAAPCKLLDDVIGDGARAALRRRAGTVCRVVTGGRVRVGDAVDLRPDDHVAEHP